MYKYVKKKKGSNAVVKVGFGAKGSTFIPMLAGFAGGFGMDMFYGSMGLPGYDQRMNNCAAFSVGDGLQLIGLTALTFLSFITRSWTFAAFAFGATAGSMTPKLLAAFNMPRYGLFDLDPKSGTLSPLGGGARGAYQPINNAAKAVGDAVGKIIPQKANHGYYY